MRKTAREIVEMGREGFPDAMLAELEAKAQRSDLSVEERRDLREQAKRTRAELAARRGQLAAAKRAA